MDQGPELRSYLDELTGRLRTALGDELIGVWLVGSAALGGFSLRHSDVDVLMISRSVVAPADRQAIAALIGPDGIDCPAQGLELVWYAEAEVRPLGSPPVFQLNLNGGRDREHKVQLGPGDEAEHWFVIDLAIARGTAVTWFGPALAQIADPVPQQRLLAALRQSLTWHDAFDAGSPNRVLNAARAIRYLSTGVWVDKASAADWLADRQPTLAPALRAASRAREQGRCVDPESAEAVIAAARRLLNQPFTTPADRPAT